MLKWKMIEDMGKESLYSFFIRQISIFFFLVDFFKITFLITVNLALRPSLSLPLLRNIL